ncbi:MAG: hypothetical protein ACJ8F7_05185, partial [Gemmataceae bacterium]
AWWRRWSPAGILAALTTASIFVGWEYYTHRRYGESHFLVSLRLSETTPFTRIAVFMSLFELLGLVGPGVVLIVMVGLRFRERWLILAAVILIAQYGALCVVPWSSASSWQDPYKPRLFGFNVLVIGSWGWATLISLGLALRPLVWRSRPPAGSWRSWLAGHRNRRHPMTGLLAAWLLAEAAAFMTLTPFPASRRIMGISVVIFLLVARLSSRVVRLSGSRKRLWWAAALSAGLGALYATIDAEDAGFEPRAIAAADDYIRAHDPNPTVWYFGHWGFQYAAEKRGYQPVIAGPNLPRVGDWLVEPPLWLRLRPYGRDERPGELACTITLDRWLRLRTMPPYYGGMHAMEWWPRPHFEAKVYRIDSNWEVKHP